MAGRGFTATTLKHRTMSVITLLLLGGVTGAIADLIMRSHDAASLVLNVLVGAAGVMLAWSMTPDFGASGASQPAFSASTLVLFLLVTVSLLGVAQLLRTGVVRR